MHDEEHSLYVDTPGDEPEVTHAPRVVVAVDGSPASKAALRFAIEDAARRGVPVRAVIAYGVPESWMECHALGTVEEDRLRHTMRREQEETVRAAVDEVTGELSGPLPDVQTCAVPGSPADVLIRESEGADLLVVGSRGHGGFHSMLLGSTSIQCAMHATCPVTVVHAPAARRHRLRLHRERRGERSAESRSPVDALSRAVPPA